MSERERDWEEGGQRKRQGVTGLFACIHRSSGSFGWMYCQTMQQRRSAIARAISGFGCIHRPYIIY